MTSRPVAARWDAEYLAGRYAAEPPLPFVASVLAVLDEFPAVGAGVGLYVGCGNGRNLLPLVDAGLDLFFLRVNSASTEVYHRHAVVERSAAGGFTVAYEEGPKRGLLVHFYSARELLALDGDRFRVIREPREDVTRRESPKTGTWAQWEAVWQRR
jgi:hypothetical protein